ncbi:hypothetical protein DPMN_162694 [Dreissena polymorpha]|uniref:Uncharacterized protein n=1 Tax=Dreissena polymorpha TaxID=45954 RepID=A0A9D4ITV5_DREPO|nr:hypothetical protein DPMN_162694 [Dreissena polymorpha]
MLIKTLSSPFPGHRTSTWCLCGKSKEPSHSGYQTHDHLFARQTPCPLHHGDLRSNLHLKLRVPDNGQTCPESSARDTTGTLQWSELS